MDWTVAEKFQDGKWVAIDCRQCVSKDLNMCFNPPLMVCIHEEVRGKSTDRPACEVARSPFGACGQHGKFWAQKPAKEAK